MIKAFEGSEAFFKKKIAENKKLQLHGLLMKINKICVNLRRYHSGADLQDKSF